MGDVLRIIDRFKITGHGVIYTVKISKGANVRMGDLLSDLRGNRFEVSGIEMFRRKIPEGKTFEDMPLGLMLKQIDGVDPFGNILVKNLKEINFIFCNHPLYQRKVDEDYEDEYQEAGLHMITKEIRVCRETAEMPDIPVDRKNEPDHRHTPI